MSKMPESLTNEGFYSDILSGGAFIRSNQVAYRPVPLALPLPNNLATVSGSGSRIGALLFILNPLPRPLPRPAMAAILENNVATHSSSHCILHACDDAFREMHVRRLVCHRVKVSIRWREQRAFRKKLCSAFELKLRQEVTDVPAGLQHSKWGNWRGEKYGKQAKNTVLTCKTWQAICSRLNLLASRHHEDGWVTVSPPPGLWEDLHKKWMNMWVGLIWLVYCCCLRVATMSG